MTQCCESTALSTMWISVQIENSGDANASEIFAFFINLKKILVSFKGIDLNPPLSGQINGLQINIVNQQPVHHLSLSLSVSLPWSWDSPKAMTMTLEISNVYPR